MKVISFPREQLFGEMHGKAVKLPSNFLSVSSFRLMLHDEDVYPDPHAFNPDRFLGPNPQPDPTDHGAFGYGRRYACATANLILILLRVLQ
jgi:cytochrome P450